MREATSGIGPFTAFIGGKNSRVWQNLAYETRRQRGVKKKKLKDYKTNWTDDDADTSKKK
jgi:hypothetical protein